MRVTREQAAAHCEKNFRRFWDHQLRRVKEQAESANWAGSLERPVEEYDPRQSGAPSPLNVRAHDEQTSAWILGEISGSGCDVSTNPELPQLIADREMSIEHITGNSVRGTRPDHR